MLPLPHCVHVELKGQLFHLAITHPSFLEVMPHGSKQQWQDISELVVLVVDVYTVFVFIQSVTA